MSHVPVAMQLAMKKARVGSRAGARPNGYRRVRPRTRKPTPSHGAEGLQRIGRAQTPGAEGGGVLGRRDWEGLKEPSIDLGLFLSGFQAGVGDVCEKRSDTRRNTDEETDGACGQMCATVGSVPTGYISNAGGSDDAGCLRGHRGAKCVPHRSRGLITRPARARTPRPPPLLRSARGSMREKPQDKEAQHGAELATDEARSSSPLARLSHRAPLMSTYQGLRGDSGEVGPLDPSPAAAGACVNGAMQRRSACRLRRQYRNAPAFPDRRINRNGHYRDRARSPSTRSRAVDSAHRPLSMLGSRAVCSASAERRPSRQWQASARPSTGDRVAARGGRTLRRLPLSLAPPPIIDPHHADVERQAGKVSERKQHESVLTSNGAFPSDRRELPAKPSQPPAPAQGRWVQSYNRRWRSLIPRAARSLPEEIERASERGRGRKEEMEDEGNMAME
ncbi:unnamed protein product [Lampetra fluviatilis]